MNNAIIKKLTLDLISITNNRLNFFKLTEINKKSLIEIEKKYFEDLNKYNLSFKIQNTFFDKIFNYVNHSNTIYLNDLIKEIKEVFKQ